MKLKEALEFRKKCIIHGLPMRPSDGAFLLNDAGLSRMVLRKVNSRSIPVCGLRFSFNGTYIRTTDFPKSFSSAVTVDMMCEECAKSPIHEERLGATTLANILDIQHHYSILLVGGSDNKYVCKLQEEIIRYHVNDKFYHTGIDLQNKKAFCTMGSCCLGDKFDDVLRRFSIMEVPQFNMEKLENIEQYVDKLKLYNLFS